MQQLRESGASKTGRGCLVLFALFWTSFSVIWTWTAWRGGSGVFALFGLPFIAIGIALLLGAFWRSIAGLRISRPELTVSREVLRPGETFFAQYHQSFRFPVDILESKVELVFRETAIYRRGTDTYTEVHEDVLDFFESPTGHFEAGATTRSDGNMTIPASAMHSFTGTNNKLQWFLRVSVNAQGWPDVKDEFELKVLAEGG
jgi:hypothetical protein